MIKRLLQYVFCIIVGVCFLLQTSCVNDINQVKSLERPSSPDETFKEVKMIRSVEGVVEIEMITPLVNRYEGANARIEYPKGIFIKFFNTDKSLKSTLSAKYAINNISAKTMEARNNIIIIDYKSGDTIYTEQIIWDQDAKKIYSNKMLKRVGSTKITYGDGFEANELMDSIIIKNSRGTFEWKERNKNH